MATLGVYSSVAWLASGGVAANATVEVRRESDSGLAAIYSDRAGTAAITNPSAFADSNGRFTFFAAGLAGGYSVKVTSGAFNYTLRYQRTGTAGELDAWDSFWTSVLATASAAAARLALGFSAIAAKGDSWWGSAADTVAKLTVGANGLILMARSAASAGVAWVAALNKTIYGLTYANGTDAVNDLNINVGGAMDATGAYWMTLATALGKQSDVAWAVGGTTGAPVGGVDTGAPLGNVDAYIWLIARSDTGVVDALFSLSSTAPTMPTNYDFKRLIGWFKRVGGTIVAFHAYETEGGGLNFLWDSPTLDVNLSNTLTTARRTDALKVPLNFSTVAEINFAVFDAGAASRSYICCPDVTDLAPSTTVAPLSSVPQSLTTSSAFGNMKVRTSAAGLVASRSDVATVDTYQLVTIGFSWARRN